MHCSSAHCRIPGRPGATAGGLTWARNAPGRSGQAGVKAWWRKEQNVPDARGPSEGTAPLTAAAVARVSRDPAAFEVFYRQHVVLVIRFLGRRVADPHLVADLATEVFLAAIGSADS